MKQNDIIEVIQFDSRAKKMVRRVRVSKLVRRNGKYQISGVNMKGKYSKPYTLPLEPVSGELVPVANAAVWFPHDHTTGGDE